MKKSSSAVEQPIKIDDSDQNVNHVNVTVDNQTPHEMVYTSDWFDSGEWSTDKILTIPAGSKVTLCFRGTLSVAPGVSGTVTYNINGHAMTLGFSDPVAGSNKVGIGNDGHKVWENMGSHYENPAIYKWGFNDFPLQAEISNTSGSFSEAKIILSIY
jgi:hypothetical protein